MAETLIRETVATVPTLTIITPKDLQGASVVFERNKGFISQYQAKYDLLLKKAEEEGIKLTPETDKKINDFLVSAKTCAGVMNTDRTPYTQKANEFIKLFTNQENTLLQVFYPTLQKKRDASITQYKKEQAEDDRKAQLELDKGKQRITLLADAEQQIRNAYLDILNGDKGELLHAFETADADTIGGVEDLLKNIHPEFELAVFDSIKPVINSEILPEEELQQIIDKSREGKFDKIKEHYKNDVTAFVAHLVDLLPERKEEIAKGVESKAADELKGAQAEANQVQEVIEQQVEQQVSKQIADVIMDHKISQVHNSASIPNTAAIESYSINIVKREGWAEIFKLFFTHSPETDLGKMKLDAMKLFAERLAKSQNIKIESDSIEYQVKYKATARKGK